MKSKSINLGAVNLRAIAVYPKVKKWCDSLDKLEKKKELELKKIKAEIKDRKLYLACLKEERDKAIKFLKLKKKIIK